MLSYISDCLSKYAKIERSSFYRRAKLGTPRRFCQYFHCFYIKAFLFFLMAWLQFKIDFPHIRKCEKKIYKLNLSSFFLMQTKDSSVIKLRKRRRSFHVFFFFSFRKAQNRAKELYELNLHIVVLFSWLFNVRKYAKIGSAYIRKIKKPICKLNLPSFFSGAEEQN